MPWLCAFGAGILNVMALWNLRRRGSTVTIGDTATPRPSNFAVRSGSMGCACDELLVRLVLQFLVQKLVFFFVFFYRWGVNVRLTDDAG